MVLSPELILLFVRGVIKLGTAARGAYEQKLRDQKITLPPPLATYGDPLDLVVTYFRDKVDQQTPQGKYHAMVAAGGPLYRHWDHTRNIYRDTDEDKAVLIAAAVELLNASNTTAWQTSLSHGDDGTMLVLSQWRDSAAPPQPWLRVAMAVADVALSYVAIDPRLLVRGGNAEKLVSAFSSQVAGLLPDPTTPSQISFVQRFVAAFFEGGFRTLVGKPDLLSDEKHWQAMAAAVAAPMAKSLSEALKAAEANPGNLEASRNLFDWMNIRDALLPELVQAGLDTLIAHQMKFLGRDFDPNSRTGALTQAFLATAKDVGVSRAKGWLPIYHSLLKAIAARSDAIIKGDGHDDAFYKQLLVNVANTMDSWQQPFSGKWKTDLATSVLDTLATTMPLPGGNPWSDVAVAALQDLASGFAEGLRQTGGISSVLTEQALLDLLRILAAQAARTPDMLLRSGANSELKAIVAAVAHAMTLDKKLLITADGWKTIISVATGEAARNPARLFKLDGTSPDKQLGVKLIACLLDKVSAYAKRDRIYGFVVFGDTLTEALVITLREAAGNADEAGTEKALLAIGDFVTRLNDLTTRETGRIGASEWLWLFRKFLPEVIDRQECPYSADDLRAKLYQG